MALHFSRDEFAARLATTRDAMQQRGLDGMLIFRQESMFYLTGYDTFGYVYFQCLVIDDQGRFTLLTRAPDLRQARHTSLIEDIRVWVDKDGADPYGMLRDILRERGCAGRRLGIEFDAYGLTARSGMRVEAALDGFCALEDASDLVSNLRLIKSPQELACIRKAAELSDLALAEARRLAAPGADESEILAAMQSAVFTAGGDFPANPFVIGSGPGALMCRYHSGRRTLAADDQLTLEFAGGLAPLPRSLDADTAPRPGAAAATGHAGCRCRCIAGGEGRLATRAAGRRCLCRPRPGPGRRRIRSPPLERLRLQRRRHLRPDLGRSAHALPRRHDRGAARHGVLSAHDPDGQRQRSCRLPRLHGGRRGERRQAPVDRIPRHGRRVARIPC